MANILDQLIKGTRKVPPLLWPPIKAKQTRKYLELNSSKKEKRQIQSITRAIAKHLQEEQSESAESWAKLIFDSESNRRATIESKATSYLFALGLSVGIVSVIPLLFSDTWEIPLLLALFAGGLYILTIVHFIAAVVYSIRVRRIAGIKFPSADEFLTSLKDRKLSSADRIRMYISISKLNEPILTLKANYLVVAERMFLRGLIFFALAAGIAVFSKVYIESRRTTEHVNITPMKEEEPAIDSLEIPLLNDSLDMPAAGSSTIQDSTESR